MDRLSRPTCPVCGRDLCIKISRHTGYGWFCSDHERIRTFSSDEEALVRLGGFDAFAEPRIKELSDSWIGNR